MRRELKKRVCHGGSFSGTTFEAWRDARTKAALRVRLKGLNHGEGNSTRPRLGVAIAALLGILVSPLVSSGQTALETRQPVDP
jgi:hypothetical protein